MRSMICAGTLALCLAAGASPAQEAPKAGPPEWPAFDEAQVRSRIERILDKDSRQALKIGYFAPMARPPFDRANALLLIADAAQAEGYGSARWFALQDMLGYGSLRSGRERRQRALAAYDALFTQAMALDAKPPDWLPQTLREFVYDMGGPLMYRLTEPEKSAGGKALGKAYECWMRQAGADHAELPVARAVERLEKPDCIVEIAERLTGEHAPPPTYSVWKRAAIGLEAYDAGKSLACMQKAEPLLPAGDVLEARLFYHRLVALIEKTGKPADALAAQKRMVAASGKGQAALAILLDRQGDKAAIEKTCAELSAPGADAQEVWEMAQYLSSLRSGAGADVNAKRAKGVALLQAYLAAPGERDPIEELRARRCCAEALVKLERPRDALAVLSVEHLRERITTVQRRVALKSAMNLAAQIQKQLDKGEKQP